MIFLSAWAFGLLSLSALIAFLYFLRRREERVTVSAIWLWSEEQERPRSALVLLWTKIWLLLVQVAALGALVFSLARPTLTQEFLGGGTLALIIDGSASMQTSQDNKTRYEQALKIAQELIERRRPSQLTVIQAQRSPKLLVPLTEDRARALKIFMSSQPTLQSDVRSSDLIELLRSQGELDTFDEVIFISDREPSLPFAVTWLPVGESAKNLAITGFAARPLPDGTPRVTLWARVENFSQEALQGNLKLFVEDTEIFNQRLDVEPSGSRTIETLAPLRSRFRAALDVTDDFAFDNVRYSVIPARPKLKILWLGERNFFLMRALSTFAELRIQTDDSQPPDLIIAHDTTIRSFVGKALLINSSAEPWVVHTGNVKEAKLPQIATPNHALVQNVRAEHLLPTTLMETKLAPDVQTLIASGDQPILAAYRSESVSFIYLGVNLKDSPLVLTPSFPILVRHSLFWLMPELGLPSEQFISEDFATPGFAEQTAINLDPSESEINRPQGIPPARREPSPRVRESSAHTPLWQVGAWVALGVLLIEFFWYYRGVFRRREVDR